MRFGNESKNEGEYVVVLGICSLVLPCGISRLLWRHGRVLASHAEGRGFNPQPGQKMIRFLSPPLWLQRISSSRRWSA